MKIKEVQSIIKDFESSNLMSLELEMDSFKLKLSKNKQEETLFETKNNPPLINIPEEKFIEPTINLPTTTIKSPLVGTFYESSSPDAAPFVKKGDYIKKGDVVCIIEAMKIMNEITSSVDGVIQTVHATNGSVVGYDDVLFTVEIDANTK